MDADSVCQGGPSWNRVTSRFDGGSTTSEQNGAELGPTRGMATVGKQRGFSFVRRGGSGARKDTRDERAGWQRNCSPWPHVAITPCRQNAMTAAVAQGVLEPPPVLPCVVLIGILRACFCATASGGFGSVIVNTPSLNCADTCSVSTW
jgi:hypothetical protein